LVFISCENYLGNTADNVGAISSFSTCILAVVCNVVTNNYQTPLDTSNITLEASTNYTFTSFSIRLTVSLNVAAIDVMGICNFISINVFVLYYFILYFFM
jgi:hypothetical protein